MKGVFLQLEKSLEGQYDTKKDIADAFSINGFYGNYSRVVF